MSANPLSFWYNPALALGVMTFQNNRLDTYESLIDILDNRDTSTARVQKIFETWAERDKARMETRHLVFSAIASRLARGGLSFAECIKPFVSNEEFLIINSAKANGNLVVALRLLVRNINANASMKDEAFKALQLPATGILMLIALSVGFGRAMWPDFMRILPPKYWPTWSMPAINFQLWLGEHWYAISFAALIVFAYYWTRDRWTGKSRDWADKLPPWSIYKGKQASSFLGVMSALIQAGKTVREGMKDIENLADPYLKWQVARMVARYDIAGDKPMLALRTGLFTPMLVDRVEDSSASRDFARALSHVGDAALELVLRVVNRQAKAAAGLLMFFVGAGFIYFYAVVIIGIQEANESYIRVLGGGSIM